MKASDSAISAPPTADDAVGLDWLLAQPSLCLIPIHVADGSDEPVRVSWVHAIEIDDPSPWLRPGGLVLTTGLRLPRSRDLQAAYIARLRQAGAAGLGFGTGLRFASVPVGVVEACKAQGLSLVEVPLPTPFLAVTQAVTDRISQQRRWHVQEVLDAQRALTRAALKGGGPAVARTLCRLMKSGVHLVDADRSIVASVGDTSGAATETQALGSASAPAGWLTMVRDQPLAPSERLVLNHAVSLLSLDLVHLQVPSEEDVGSLLAALLGSRGFDPGPVLARVGFRPDDSVTLIGLRAAEVARTPAVATQLRRSLPDVHLYGSAPRGGPERFVLVPTVTATDVEVTLVRAAIARAQAVTLAVGLPVPMGQIAVTLPAVMHALAVPPPAARPHVVRLADATTDALLPADARAALEAATAPWLALLAVHDESHGTALCASLTCFLTHHGRPDPAARELGIHRHTLRHRLTRAEEVAGFDLDDPTHRALLVLTLERTQNPSSYAKLTKLD